MTPDKYIKNALRTEPKKYKFTSTGDISPRIEHASMGITTEAGEIMDAIKKSKIYGQKLDKTNLIEEIGDMMWYLAIMSDALGVSFESIWDKNIRKLKIRFPEKYTHELAKESSRNRDLERKEVES